MATALSHRVAAKLPDKVIQEDEKLLMYYDVASMRLGVIALLGIVDQAPDVDHRIWDERWNEEEARFLSLRAKAREIVCRVMEGGREAFDQRYRRIVMEPRHV